MLVSMASLSMAAAKYHQTRHLYHLPNQICVRCDEEQTAVVF
jgi:hypothetical protein